MKNLFRVFSLVAVCIFLAGCSQLSLSRILGNEDDLDEKLKDVERIIITPRRGGTEVDVEVKYRENSNAELSVRVVNQAPMSVVVDASYSVENNHAQALVPMMELSFTAKNRTTIYGLRFNRSGISHDGTAANLYLYESGDIGDNEIAQYTASDGRYVEFRNPDGLFIIPTGATVNVLLRADISGTAVPGQTIRFDIETSEDIDAGAIKAEASFPLKGSTASVTSVSDLGYISFANVSPTGNTTVPSGYRYYYGWRFSLVASDQDMELRFLKITNTGTATQSDIGNFRLMYLDEIITRAEMTDNDEIVFDLANNPHLVPQGQTHNLDMVFDIAQDATGTFHFMVQEMNHILVFDRTYEVFTTPNQNDNWTVIESNSSSTSTVIEGTPESEIPGQGIFVGEIELSLASDSPTGNIASGATNVVVAKFNAYAIGEDIMINSLNVGATSIGLNNGRVYVDGSQIGSTVDLIRNGSYAFNLKTNLVIKEDKIRTIEIRADVKNNSGTDLTDGDTFGVALFASSANARGLQSGMAISTSAIMGNTLTARTGTVITTKNMAVADASASRPSGVIGEMNVLIGSFIITGGSGEGSKIHQITLKNNLWNDGGITLADVFQNLRLEAGGPADTNGNYYSEVLIGRTISSLVDADDTVYRFTPSPAIDLPVGASMVINIYADILNSASKDAISVFNSNEHGVIFVSEVSATGVQTGSNTSDSDGTYYVMQRVYIAQKGELIIEAPPSSYQAWPTIAVAGTEDVELFRFRLTAENEDMDIARLIVSISLKTEEWGAMNFNGSQFSALKNFKLLNGREQIGPTLASYSMIYRDAPMNGYIDFNFGTANSYRIPKGEERILTVTATISNWPTISSGCVYQMFMSPDPLMDGTPAITAHGAGSSRDLSGPEREIRGNPFTVRKSVPLVERMALPTTTLSSSGTHTLAKFRITSVENQTRQKKWTFSVAWTDYTTSTELEINNFKLFRNGAPLSQSEYTIYDGLGIGPEHILSQGGNATLKVSQYGSHISAAINAVLVFGDRSQQDMAGEEIIPDGSINIYELRADVMNAHQGASTDTDNISVTLLGDNDHELPWTGQLQTHPVGVVTVRPDANSNFIWSDYSADTGLHDSRVPGNPSGTGWPYDWTDGLLVPADPRGDTFLPLDSWNLSK